MVKMFKCTVQMFGLPQQVTSLPQVEVEIKEGASIPELVMALRNALPSLKGPVIAPGEARLNESYAFVVNGEFQSNDSEIRLHNGDRVVLILLAVGG
jgi:hypothetical protein